jgi:hypothetical protein
MVVPINPIRWVTNTQSWRPFMAKTVALFFVLGLMVSCASHHNERTISSVDQNEQAHGFNERAAFSGGGRGR